MVAVVLLPVEADPIAVPFGPPSRKVMVVPEGADVAVSVTDCPKVEGFGEVVSVKGCGGFTVWVTVLEQPALGTPAAPTHAVSW